MTSAQQPPSPVAIIDLISGFRSARFLMAAVELGLFEALAAGPADLAGLAARTGLTPRAVRICADAMVAVGMLERDGDDYRNSAAAAAHLTEGAAADLRPFVRYSDKVSYPAWGDLADALRFGPTRRITDLDPETQKIFSEGIEVLNAAPAAALAVRADLAGRTRLLDVGGGTGSWSVALLRTRPGLTATVFELPQVVGLAERRIAGELMTERIGVAGGDLTVDELPAGHDCALLANVVHCFSPDNNRMLLAKIRRAVVPGARLLIADNWTDATHTRPVLAALMAGEYAVNIEDGDVYSVEEARDWLAATGWRFLGHEGLTDSKSVVVAEAV